MNEFYTHAGDPWEASVAFAHLFKPRRKLVIYAPPLVPFLLLSVIGSWLLLVIAL